MQTSLLKICQAVIATLLLYSSSAVAAPTGSQLVRFEFSNYEGEGAFTLYRIDVNLKSRNGHLCFLDSTNVIIPHDIAGIVYREESWTGHFDFDKAQNKACFDFQLAKAVDWFASPKPIAYGEYEYQMFFIGKLTSISSAATVKEASYLLNGDLNILMRRVSSDTETHDIFTASVKLTNQKSIVAK